MSKPKQTDQARSGEAWITNKKVRELEGYQLRHLVEGIDLSPDSHRKSANIIQNAKLSAKDYMAAKKISLALLPGLDSQKEVGEMRHLVNSMKNEDSKNKRLFGAKQNNFIKSSKNSNSSTSQAFDCTSQRLCSEVSIGKQLPSRVKQDPKSGSSLIMPNTSLRNVSASNQKYQLAPKESKTDSYRCVTDKTVDWTQGLTRIDTVPKHKLEPPETSTEFQNRVSTKPKHVNAFLKETISSIGSTIATGTGLGYMKTTSKGYKPAQGLKECIDNIMVKPNSSTHADRTPKHGQPFLGLKEFSITNMSRQIQNKKGQKNQCMTSASEKSESSTKFKTMSRIVLEKPGSILSSLQIGSGTHNWQHNLSGIANPISPNHKSGHSGLGLQSLLDERVRLAPSSGKQGNSNKTAIQNHAKKVYKTSSRSNSLLDEVMDADSCTVIKGLNLEYRGNGGTDNDEVNLDDDLMEEGTLSNQDDVSMGLIQHNNGHEYDDDQLETQTVPTFSGSTAQQLFLHEVMAKGRTGTSGHPGKGTDAMFATTSSNKENDSNRQNKLSLPSNNPTQKATQVDLQRGKRIVSQLISNSHLLNQQSTPKGALSIFSQAGFAAFNRKQGKDPKHLDGSRDKRRELTEDDLSDCHSITRDRLLAEERSWRHPVEEASHNSQFLGKPSQLLLQIGQFKPTLTKIPQSTKTAVSSLLAPLQSQRVLSQTHTKPAKSIMEHKIREATDLKNLRCEQANQSTKKSNLLASALNQGAGKTKAKSIMEAIESRTGHSYIPRNLQTKISKAICKTGAEVYQQPSHQVHHSMHQRQLASGHKRPRGQGSVSLLDKSVASVRSCNTPIELKQSRAAAAAQNTQPLQTSGLLCNESRIDVSQRILQAGELCEGFNQSRHETLARVLQEGLNNLGSQTGNTSLWDIEVLQNLYKAERDYTLNPHYLESTRIKPYMRSKLLEWLMQVCDEYAFSRLTFHLAVNYVDRYLAADLEVSTRNLQLVGLVCLVLACKIEQVYVPKLSDFSEMALCNFSVEDIALMELSISQKLSWKLHPVTLCIWANWYTCHWDAFITNNPIVSRYSMMPKLVSSSKRVTFKVKEDQSYIRYRRLMQLIDCCILDHTHLQYKQRPLVASFMYLLIGFECEQFSQELLVETFPFFSAGMFQINASYNELFTHFLELYFGLCLEELIPTIQYASAYFDLEVDLRHPYDSHAAQRDMSEFHYEDYIMMQTYHPGALTFVEKKRSATN